MNLESSDKSLLLFTMDPSTATSLVQVSVDDRGVALLQINRPEKRNALSQQTIDCLVSTIAMIERDEKVRAAILTGSRTGGPFSGTCPDLFHRK